MTLLNNSIEFKYDASNISLTRFGVIIPDCGMIIVKNVERMIADHYFWNDDLSRGFLRVRDEDDTPSVTFKQRSIETNIWVRHEVSLPIDPSRLSFGELQQFCKAMGFPNYGLLFKQTFEIHLGASIMCSYSTVYNQDHNFVGQFIEIASVVKTMPEDEALSRLHYLETRIAKKLGVPLVRLGGIVL